MKRLVARVSVVLCLLLPIGAGSVTAAQALSKDDTFTFLLNTKDYYYGSDKASINLAKDICKRVEKSKTKKAKVRRAKKVGLALKLTGWSFDKSNQFINAAAVVYCPGQSSYMSGWVKGY